MLEFWISMINLKSYQVLFSNKLLIKSMETDKGYSILIPRIKY